MKKCEKSSLIGKIKLVTDLELKKSRSWAWAFWEGVVDFDFGFEKWAFKNCLLTEKKRRALKKLDSMLILKSPWSWKACSES